MITINTTLENALDPQQELFTALKINLEEKGAVYDGFLPPEDTPYPFYYLGDTRQNDKELKGTTHGLVYQTIHLWHNNPQQRGTFSNLLLAAKSVCRSIQKTKNYAWTVRSLNQRILPDNTTVQPLLHGIIEVEFYFS